MKKIVIIKPGIFALCVVVCGGWFFLLGWQCSKDYYSPQQTTLSPE